MSSDGPQYPQYPQYPGSEPDRGTPGQQPPAQQWPAPGAQVPPPGWAPQPPQQVRDNPKATWSMILGILSMLCCGFFTGIPAIILSRKAKREIEEAQGWQTGSGMATAGLVLGILASVGWFLYLAFIVVMIATNGFGEGLD